MVSVFDTHARYALSDISTKTSTSNVSVREKGSRALEAQRKHSQLFPNQTKTTVIKSRKQETQQPISINQHTMAPISKTLALGAGCYWGTEK